MARIEINTILQAPLEKVFRYIESIDHLTEWNTALVEVHDVVGQGEGAHYRYTYKMMGLLFKGEATTLHDQPFSRLTTVSKGGILSTWDSTFEPAEAGTRWTLVVDYTIPIPILGKVAEALVLAQNEREIALAVHNVHLRMEVPEVLLA